MKKILITVCITLLASIAVASDQESEMETVLPSVMNKSDISGDIFSRPDTKETKHDGGHTSLDVSSFMSSDKKLGSGMYKAGKSRFEAKEPWGVDEFMYFLEGGVTLTSTDGTVQVISTGEAVTIPKEWTGIWETEGYTKIWVIYSEDGSAL